MESDTSLMNGFFVRRYSTTSLPDVFVSLQQPDGKKGIAFKISANIKIDLSRYRTLKDVKLDIVPDERDNKKAYLLFSLINNQHIDVFATLAEDLVNEVATVRAEETLLKEILNRFEKWKSLFDKAGLDGLTPEEQRGLFGELFFLRKWLYKATNLQHCVQSWLGAEKELRDFQYGGWAIEVKTTHGNNHQRIQVSNERQLDNSNLEILMLFHVSLESQQRNGETLVQIVNSIIEFLSNDILAQVQFRSKLLQGGYFFHHEVEYGNIGYQIRQETFYNVYGDFPRIGESELRRGVGDVKYSIILSDFSSHLVSDSSVYEIINP